MGSRDENLPFQIGTTAGATAVGDLVDWEGKEFEIEDYLYGSNPALLRSNRRKKIRIVRNVSTVALLPKQLATYKTGKTTQIDGHTKTSPGAATAAQLLRCCVIDEFLPAAGCPVNDLCYAVIEGPTLVLTNTVSLVADIVEGDCVVSATNAASTNTSAGRIQAADYSGATTALTNNIKYAIGKALTACTSQGYSVGVLVDVGYGNRCA